MIFSSAYATVMGILPPLITPETAVISDELNHNCIINAIRLARPRATGTSTRICDIGAAASARWQAAAAACTPRDRRDRRRVHMRGDHAPLDRDHGASRRASTRDFAENVLRRSSTTRTASARSARPGAGPRRSRAPPRRPADRHARQGVRRERRLRRRQRGRSSPTCARRRRSMSIRTRSRRARRRRRCAPSRSSTAPEGAALLAHLRGDDRALPRRAGRARARDDCRRASGRAAARPRHRAHRGARRAPARRTASSRPGSAIRSCRRARTRSASSSPPITRPPISTRRLRCSRRSRGGDGRTIRRPLSTGPAVPRGAPRSSRCPTHEAIRSLTRDADPGPCVTRAYTGSNTRMPGSECSQGVVPR